MTERVELRVVPGMEGLETGHPALEQAVDEFTADLRQLSGIKVEERDAGASPGSKGGLLELVTSPESVAAAWTVARMAKLWLSRDRRRSLTVTIERPGQEPQTVTATGDSVSVKALESAIHDAFGSQAVDDKPKKRH